MKKILVVLSFSFSVFLLNAQLSESDKVIIKIELALLVNDLRVSKGLEALTFHPQLEKAAIIQSMYMARENKLTHYQNNKELAEVSLRIAASGDISFVTVGENVLHTATKKFPITNLKLLASEMYESWKNSPGHYANMISPDFTMADYAFKTNMSDNKIYATQVFGSFGTQVSGQLSDNAFGLKDAEANCTDEMNGFMNLIVNMGNGILIENNNVNFYYHNMHFFDKIFSEDNDGLAADIVSREQFECGNVNKIDGSPIHDGVLLPPVYKKDILLNNTAQSGYRLISKIGTVPEHLRDQRIATSLVLIKDGKKCKYLVPAPAPNKAYQLRPIEPILDNTSSAKLLRKGIVHTQEISYEFKTNIETPLSIPRIRNIDLPIHSIDILSYSSIEGDVDKNIDLHQKRAANIKNHLRGNFDLKDDQISVKADENWNKMIFQFTYLFADSLNLKSREDIKSMIAGGDQSLPWDSLLFDQRKSLASINYLKKISDGASMSEIAELNIRTALATNNIDLANRALYKLNKESNAYPEILFETNVFEAILVHPELVQNASALFSRIYSEDLFMTTTFISNWLPRLDELSKDAMFNLLHLYSLTGITLLNQWDVSSSRLSYVVHPLRVNSLASNVTKVELLLNLHLTYIRYFGQVNDGLNIRKSFDFITDYLEEHRLSIQDEIDLSLFCNRWSMYHMTIDLLRKRLNDNTLTEDAAFVLAQTVYLYSKDELNSVFKEASTRASEFNATRWCDWMNRDFQCLRDINLKEIYCKKCQ